MSKNYYEILGVPQNATQDEVKRKYRNRAKTEHPDQGGDTEAFKEVTVAYGTLGDPDKRKIYDEMLFSESQSQMHSTPSQPNFSKTPAKTSKSFFSPSSETAWFSKKEHEPYHQESTHAYFFEKRAHVFRPSTVKEKNFMPFVAQSPLLDIFELLFEGVTSANKKATSDNTSAPEVQKESKNDYACGKGEGYVFVVAPSREEMADLIIRTLVLQAVLFSLVSNYSQKSYSGFESHRTGFGPTVVDLDTNEELSSVPSFK